MVWYGIVRYGYILSRVVSIVVYSQLVEGEPS